MNDKKKEGRYLRLFSQLEKLLVMTSDPLARMSSICAVLHHKMEYFFWTGFYMLREENLVVGPYQGPLACQELEMGKGVCWTAVRKAEPVLVPDVNVFPGHIACDARSRSEIALPVIDREGRIRAVFDVDSTSLNAFSDIDQVYLDKILGLIYK